MDLLDLTGIEMPLQLDEDFGFRVERFTQTGEPGYLRIEVQAQPTLDSKLRVLPKDIVFLIDASGSIQDSTLTEVTAGVADALSALNPGDRFNVVHFSDGVTFFHDQSRLIEATPATIASASTFLRQAKAGGFTAVDAAVRQLLIPQAEPGRVYSLVLITDGVPTRGVLKSDELINLVTADNNRVAGIYTVGVGRKINRTLLDYLAYRNRGFARFADRDELIRPTLRELSQTLRYPLITSVTAEVAGIEPGSVYPLRLPDIHRGQTLDLYGRFNEAGPMILTLSGQSARGKVDLTMARDLARTGWAGSAIRQGWASRKLHSLYSDYLRQGKPALRSKKSDVPPGPTGLRPIRIDVTLKSARFTRARPRPPAPPLPHHLPPPGLQLRVAVRQMIIGAIQPTLPPIRLFLRSRLGTLTGCRLAIASLARLRAGGVARRPTPLPLLHHLRSDHRAFRFARQRIPTGQVVPFRIASFPDGLVPPQLPLFLRVKRSPLLTNAVVVRLLFFCGQTFKPRGLHHRLRRFVIVRHGRGAQIPPSQTCRAAHNQQAQSAHPQLEPATATLTTLIHFTHVHPSRGFGCH